MKLIPPLLGSGACYQFIKMKMMQDFSTCYLLFFYVYKTFEKNSANYTQIQILECYIPLLDQITKSNKH